VAARGKTPGNMKRVSARVLLAATLSIVAVVLTSQSSFAYGYATAVLADLPRVYIPFDEGSGSAAAASVGTGCSGVPGWGGGFVSGSTHSFAGNGSGACYNASGSLTIPNGGVSVEMWYAGISGSSTFVKSLMDTSEFDLFTDGTNSISMHMFRYNTGGWEATRSCSRSGWNNSSAHHFVGTVGAGVMHVYLDGTLCDSSSSGSVADNIVAGSGCLMVGAKPSDCAGTHTGAIGSGSRVGQVAVYGFALSSARIAAHYAAASATPASVLDIDPAFQDVIIGHSATYILQSTDSTGAATDGSPYTFTGAVPSGSVTCTMSGAQASCTGVVVGENEIDFSDNLGHTSHAFLAVLNKTSRFAVSPPSCTTTTVGSCTYRNYSFAADGSNTSDLDTLGITPPSGVSCDPVVQLVGWQTITCRSNTVGSYTLTFTDTAGLPATAVMIVGSATNPHSCSATDLGCWTSQLIGAIEDLPGRVVGGLLAILFTSQTGPSSIDLSPLTSALWPSVACRSGQTPTAPDGIHCFAFPFSIPSDIGSVVAMLNATPSAPTIAVAWDFPLWTGTTLHESATVDPTNILTPTVMTYVRDIELVAFIVGCAFGTWRILQMVGVG